MKELYGLFVKMEQGTETENQELGVESINLKLPQVMMSPKKESIIVSMGSRNVATLPVISPNQTVTGKFNHTPVIEKTKFTG